MTQHSHPWRRATFPEKDRMSDIDLSDEISRLAAIAAAISAAVDGAEFSERREGDGLAWLTHMLAADLNAIDAAFDEERRLRHEERAGQ